MQRLATTVPRLATAGASAAAAAAAAARPATRAKSTSSLVYNVVFKRNVTYITYIVAGASALEVVYGKATDMFWNSMNNGVSAEGTGSLEPVKTH